MLRKREILGEFMEATAVASNTAIIAPTTHLQLLILFFFLTSLFTITANTELQIKLNVQTENPRSQAVLVQSIIHNNRQKRIHRNPSRCWFSQTIYIGTRIQNPRALFCSFVHCQVTKKQTAYVGEGDG